MILEVYGESVVASGTSYDNTDFEFDGFDGIKDLIEAGEFAIEESASIIQECEDDQSMIEVQNLVQEFAFLKENGYEMIHEENKFTEFFKKIGDTVKKWLDKIMDFIERFIDKITNKINGVDALRSIRNPVYNGSEFKDMNWTDLEKVVDSGNIITLVRAKYVNDLYKKATGPGGGKEAHEEMKKVSDFMEKTLMSTGYITPAHLDEVYNALTDSDSVKAARQDIDQSFKFLVSMATGLQNKSTLSAKDVLSLFKAEDKQVTYGKGTGSETAPANVPSLSELLKVVDDYVDAKQNARRQKAEAKKAANETLKTIKKMESNTNRKDRVEGAMSFVSSTIARVNSFNSALCTATLMILKEFRILSIRLAKGYKEKKAEKAS